MSKKFVIGEAWFNAFKDLVSISNLKKIHIFGVGNPIKCDDSVGLFIVSKLRQEVGSKPLNGLRIHPPKKFIESSLSKIKYSNIIIFDSVECNLEAGSIVFINLKDSNYGFFSTHNIPLKIVSLIYSSNDIFVLGVQPEVLDIGEYLSPKVKASAERIVKLISSYIKSEK